MLTHAEAEPREFDGGIGDVSPVVFDPTPPESLTCCTMGSNTSDKTSCSEVSFESVMAAGVPLGTK